MFLAVTGVRPGRLAGYTPWMLVMNAALFLHIASAIMLLGGVIGGNIVGAMARRAGDLEQRRLTVALSAPFERMTTAGVPLTVITGLVTLALFGYSITELWVLATGAVLVALVVIQVMFWNKVGPRIATALREGDDAAATALMCAPRAIAIGRLEVALGFVQVAFMVFRPAWPS
jgi:uncharacterized membrane protein